MVQSTISKVVENMLGEGDLNAGSEAVQFLICKSPSEAAWRFHDNTGRRGLFMLILDVTPRCLRWSELWQYGFKPCIGTLGTYSSDKEAPSTFLGALHAIDSF